MRCSSLLTLLFVTVGTPLLDGQGISATARLQGTVTNNGASVANVQIDAATQDGSYSLQMVTDAGGRFDFGVVPGNWNLWLDSSSASAGNLVGANLTEPVANDAAVSSLHSFITPYYTYFFAPVPNGDIYAVSGPGNFIYIISPNGATSTLISGSGLNNPVGIAVDSSGNIFVANNGNGTISKFDAHGDFLGLFASGVENCLGMKFDANGNLYVATPAADSSLPGSITKIAPDGTVSQFASVPNPINLIFDSAGNLYVANSASAISPVGNIIKIALDGTETIFAGNLIEPWGLAFDSDGNLLVSDVVAQGLYLVTPSGAVSLLWSLSTPNTRLRDIIFNAEGVLYMAQSTPGSVIYTVNYNGTQTGLSLPVLTATGAINGKVSDSSGNPFAFEQVTAQATIGGVPYSATSVTDFNGNYSFPVVGGSWIVGIADGHGLVFDQQSVQPTTSAMANFVFQPIFSQPADTTVIAGQGAIFNVGVNTLATGAFQWQISTDGGSNWANLSDNSGFSGVAGNTLSVNAPLSSLSGDEFRAVVSYPAGGNTVSASSTAATITVWTPLMAWQHVNFTQDQLNVAAISGLNATPANDGISNLEKYAFNLNPWMDGHAGLPVPTVVVGDLTLTFHTLPSDLTYTVQASTDLANWSTSGVVITTNGSQVTASYDLTGHTLAFLRILIGRGN